LLMSDAVNRVNRRDFCPRVVDPGPWLQGLHCTQRPKFTGVLDPPPAAEPSPQSVSWPASAPCPWAHSQPVLRTCASLIIAPKLCAQPALLMSHCIRSSRGEESPWEDVRSVTLYDPLALRGPAAGAGCGQCSRGQVGWMTASSWTSVPAGSQDHTPHRSI
jgi:hypothetical protein